MMNSRLNRVEKRVHKLEDCTEELTQNIGQTNRYKNEPLRHTKNNTQQKIQIKRRNYG